METTKEKPAVTTETSEETLNLPRSETPLMQFNKDTKMFFIGIPVDKVPPFEACVLFDSMKLNYLQAFSAVKLEMQNPKILTPSAFSAAKDAALATKNFLLKTKRA
jgi:hypothetical protein